MIRSTLISAGALLCLAAAGFAQTPQKVGVMSFQGAIVGTKDGQKASQAIEQKFSPRQKDFQTRQSEIAQLEDQLNKGGNLMSDDKRGQLTRDIDEKKRRLQRDAQDAQEELNQEQQKALGAIYQRMIAVVEKYAKDNAYTLILDDGNQQTSPILFASSAIDVTQDIITLYDKTASSGGPAPTSSAPTSSAPAPRVPGTTAPSLAPGKK
jgi:outer membrane protein